jgi:hypothetical protein
LKERCGELERERKEEMRESEEEMRESEEEMRESEEEMRESEEEMRESEEVKKLFCGDGSGGWRWRVEKGKVMFVVAILKKMKRIYFGFDKRVQSEIISKVENISTISCQQSVATANHNPKL